MERVKRSYTFSIILLLALVSSGSYPIFSSNGELCKTKVIQVNPSECCCSPETSSKSNCCEESNDTSEKPSSNHRYGQHNHVCNCHIAPVSSVPVNSTESIITLVQKPNFQKITSSSNNNLQRLNDQTNKKLKLLAISTHTSLSTLPVGNVCLRI